MALDLTAPKAPPAKPATAKSANASKPGVKVAPEQISNARLKTCVEVCESTAGLFAIFGMHADAGLIMMQGGTISQTVVEIGQEHEKVGDVIDILGKNSMWTKLIGVGLLFFGQLGVNHGLIKNYDKMAGAGIVSPDTLVAMSKAKLAQIEMAALAQQREAQEQLVAMQKQYREEYQSTVIDGQPVSV
jgi:hypothetical protein